MFNTRPIKLLQEHDFVAPFRFQIRLMTRHRRVKDRSHQKTVHELEVVKERQMFISRFIFILEVLKQEPENVIDVRELSQYRQQFNLDKNFSMEAFLRKAPKLLELYKDEGNSFDRKGTLWCGLTETAEELIREEEEIIAKNRDKAAEYVTRMLMMSVDKRLRVDKIVHFRRDMGLPLDFRKRWVHDYPELFKVVKPFTPKDEEEYLELVSWKPEWAITELEKKQMGIDGECGCKDHVPGLLSLAFPLKFPPEYRNLYLYLKKIEEFKKLEYLSPYAEPKGLIPGSLEFDKRAVAILHELLSFTIEKGLVTDHLTHFRREFVMPQKLMRLFLKNFGIFYVTERGKRFSVFLKEAYEGSELIHKHPLVMWKEKVQNLVAYRGRVKELRNFRGLQYKDDRDLYGCDSEDESRVIKIEGDDDSMSELEGAASFSDVSEMEIDEINLGYKDWS